MALTVLFAATVTFAVMLEVVLATDLTSESYCLAFGAGSSYSIYWKNSGADMVYLSVLESEFEIKLINPAKYGFLFKYGLYLKILKF